jgi:hypothetical protein
MMVVSKRITWPLKIWLGLGISIVLVMSWLLAMLRDSPSPAHQPIHLAEFSKNQADWLVRHQQSDGMFAYAQYLEEMRFGEEDDLSRQISAFWALKNYVGDLDIADFDTSMSTFYERIARLIGGLGFQKKRFISNKNIVYLG